MSESVERFRRFTPSGRVIKTGNMQRLTLKERPTPQTQTKPPTLQKPDTALMKQTLGFSFDDSESENDSSVPISSASLVSAYSFDTSDDDDEEEQDLLLQELEKIRKEREVQKSLDDSVSYHLIPSSDTQSSVLKEEASMDWYEDSLFGVTPQEPPTKKSKVHMSDVLKTEFHKNFLRQFIK
ncbi:hypothetical protein GEMRC1_009445 [Eukaryota sp. GEM-RC1]